MKKSEVRNQRSEVRSQSLSSVIFHLSSVFLLLTSCFLLLSCLYADINIQATVDRNTVNFGESITLQVTVAGDVANIPKPELPPLADFNVYSSGTSQNISFVNGRVSASITYNFILSPNRAGKFAIGPVKLTVSGKDYTTNPINIEVLSGQSQKPVDTQQFKLDDEKAQGLFVTAELDKRKCFVNEGITYTFRFFTSRNLFSNPEYNPPNFTGFIVEDLPPQRNYQTIINGKRYNVIEIKTKLFPTTSGKYALGSASLKASVQDFTRDPFSGFFDDDFFRGFFGGGKSVVVQSKPLSVEVLPLPTENKPADFSGAVGAYNISASVDKKEIEANNPVTLTVTISGEGNIKSIPEPQFPSIIGVRKYDTISSVNISKANYKVTGSKVFKTVLVPDRAGNLIIPEVVFSYFNPEKKEYQKLKTPVVNLKVLPSKISAVPTLPVIASGINIVGQDIRFIKTELDKNISWKSEKIIADVLLVCSVLVFFGRLGYNRYRFFVSKNYEFIRSKKAFKKFEKNINKIKHTIDVKEFYGTVFDSVVEYLSDKTSSNLSGFTFSEIENVLAQKNLAVTAIKKIRELLENADFMRFAPSVDKNVNLATEIKKIKSIISEIEKEWEI
ncbi:MAG: BatD family protein [Elusimicrobiota bacterium]